MAAPAQRRALGALFVVLALAFGGIAAAAGAAGDQVEGELGEPATEHGIEAGDAGRKLLDFDSLDHFEFGPDEDALDSLSFAVASGLYPSRSEARRQIEQGGLSINDSRVSAIDEALPEPVAGRYYVLRAGRKRLLIARRRP